MKKEKAEKMMNLEHRMRDQIQHNQHELELIHMHNQQMLKEKQAVVKSISGNEFSNLVQSEMTETNKIMAMKDSAVEKGEK